MYLIQEENAWPFMIWPWKWWPRGSFKAAPKPHLNSRWGDRDSALDGRWQGWGRAFRATNNCHLFEKIQFSTTSLPLSISSLYFKSPLPSILFISLKSRCWNGYVSSGGFRETLFPHLSQPLELAYSFWLMAPFSIFKAIEGKLSPCYAASLWLWLLCPLLAFRKTCD